MTAAAVAPTLTQETPLPTAMGWWVRPLQSTMLARSEPLTSKNRAPRSG